MSAVRWFIKCGAAAAIVARLRLRYRPVRQRAANAGDDDAGRHADHAEPLLREPMPDIVLVGSSLTFRLKEEYFATRGLRNLALAGGSPVTGLEIVANQPRLPQYILVEANVSPDPPISRWSKVIRAATLSRFFFAPCGRRWPPMSSGFTRR